MPKSRAPAAQPLPDLLSDAPAALIRLAHFEPPDTAVHILTTVLTNRGWTADPFGVSALVRQHWQTHSDVLLDAVESAVNPGEGAEFTADHALLLQWLAGVPDDELRGRIATRYEATAGPGDARLGLDLLRSALSTAGDDGGVTASDWALPVARALAETGGAEIGREGLDARLLGGLLLLQESEPGLLRVAFEHLAAGGRADPLGYPCWGALEQVFSLLETALGQGLPIALVHDLLPGNGGLARAEGYARFFQPLVADAAFPRLRAAMLQGLATGVWRDGVALEAWRAVLATSQSVALTFNHVGLDTALWSLREAAYDAVSEGPDFDGWVSVVATGWLHEFGLRRPAQQTTRTGVVLATLAHFPRYVPGIAIALGRFLVRADPHPDRDLALAVLADSDLRPELVGVALVAFPRADAQDGWHHGITLAEVDALLSRVVRFVRAEGSGHLTVDRLFQSVTRVAIRDAPSPEHGGHTDAVVWREGQTAVAAGVHIYGRLCASTATHAEALQACALYFVHEAIHVAQGVQAKRLVTALRVAASEHTLAHLDLEADDIAARVLSRALATNLVDLKDLEGRLAERFPATFHHTHASIARKSVRLLGLRSDVLIRKNARFGLEPDEPGYAFVEVPFGPGTLVFMWAGVVHRVLGDVKISQDDASWLTSVALSPVDVSAVDRRLGALLDRVELVSRCL